ncbi:MAG TPA: hypothetical protein VH834_16175 [Solirubrobacteraceae bacterium]|jgi:hypothetical protein
MKAIRGLLRDLVERRLWPVAVLLLAAALAVPVYLGRSSAENDAPLPAPTEHADLGKTSKAAVTLDTDGETGGNGGVRNPFKQQHLPKKQDTGTTGTTGTSTPAPSGNTPPTSGTGGAGGDGSLPPLGPSGTGGDKNPAPKPETDSLDLYHISVKVGRADGTMRTLKDVARLSPLPSVDDPFMVYTGVLKDGKTAVFLLSSDAKATGDGTCKPGKDDCESVEVKKGDTEFFDLTVDGQPVQYELDVLDVKKVGASGSSSSATASAAAASERHSNAGAKLLRNAHVKATNRFKGAAGYRWLPDQGVLIRTPNHGSAQASVTGATAASPADAAASLPGQPVWHWAIGA